MDHFAAIAALCSPAGGTSGGLLLVGMLLAGLAGSVAHCSLMCGPFVLAQVGARLRKVPMAQLCEQARLRHALLAPYHLGRILTYAAIGALAASLGGALRPLGNGAAGWLLLGGALLFATQGLARIAPSLRISIPTGAPGWLHGLRELTGRLDVTRPGGALLLGLALGGLPCMFLYSAVLVASATGSPAGGALAMVAFGLGTVPMLVVVGIAGHQAGRWWAALAAKLAPALLLGNAAMLTVMAWRALSGSA